MSSSLESPDASDFARAQATAMVRFVDVKSGETLWPPAATDGYPVSAATPMTQLGAGSDEFTIRAALQQQLAHRIAKLFYTHEAD